MKTFLIMLANSFGMFTICQWHAENEQEAIESFNSHNSFYLDKGLIIAEEI